MRGGRSQGISRMVGLTANLLLSVTVQLLAVAVLAALGALLFTRLGSPIAEAVFVAIGFDVLLLAHRQGRGLALRQAGVAALRTLGGFVAAAALLRILAPGAPGLLGGVLAVLCWWAFRLVHPLTLFRWGATPNLAATLTTGDLPALRRLLPTLSQEEINGRLYTTFTPLTYAIERHLSRECVELLLQHGADPNLPGLLRDTPVVKAIYENSVDVFKLLFQYGAREADRMPRDETLLHLAADFGRWEIVEFLLQRGSAVNAVDKSGNTPLHCTVPSARVTVAKFLLAYGADLAIRNTNGKTAYELARETHDTSPGLVCGHDPNYNHERLAELLRLAEAGEWEWKIARS